MIVLLKKRIVFLSFLIAVLFSFINLNVSFVYATQKSGADAIEELMKKKNENKEQSEIKKNDKKRIKKVEDNEVGETKKPSIGGHAGPHKLEENYEGKSRVLVPIGGGGMGEGGGAARSAGGKAGQSVDFSNDTNINKEVVNNSKSDTDGNDLISETMGFAKDDGQFYKENEGDHAGAKIFEFDRNGSIGIDDDHISVSNMKGFMTFFLFAAFSLGGLSFFMATRDIRSKNNYF